MPGRQPNGNAGRFLGDTAIYEVNTAGDADAAVPPSSVGQPDALSHDVHVANLERMKFLRTFQE